MKLNIKRLLKHLDDRDERRTRAILIQANTEIIDGGDKANKSSLWEVASVLIDRIANFGRDGFGEECGVLKLLLEQIEFHLHHS